MTYGLACPSCSHRGLMRVATGLYRCLPCDQDFELSYLMRRIMDGPGTTAKDGPSATSPVLPKARTPALSLVKEQS